MKTISSNGDNSLPVLGLQDGLSRVGFSISRMVCVSRMSSLLVTTQVVTDKIRQHLFGVLI